MSGAKEYYSNFGRWNIEEYIAEHILNNPQEMNRFGTIFENLPSHVSTLLDIGCGPGVFLHLLHKQTGIKGIGIEITDIKIRYAQAKLNVNVLKGNAGHLPFKDETFDVVTALELIEHLPYKIYEGALEEVQRVAKKWIIISVPHCEEIQYIPCPYCGTRFNSSYHLRSFDEKKMKILFPSFGMVKLKKIVLYSQPLFLFKKIFASFRPPLFPEFAICPTCGFKRENGPTANTKMLPTVLNKYFRPISFLMLERKRYRWYVAVYRRITNGV